MPLASRAHAGVPPAIMTVCLVQLDLDVDRLVVDFEWHLDCLQWRPDRRAITWLLLCGSLLLGIRERYITPEEELL